MPWRLVAVLALLALARLLLPLPPPAPPSGHPEVLPQGFPPSALHQVGLQNGPPLLTRTQLQAQAAGLGSLW